jgi:phosphate transport system substrate-binding protein
MRCSYLLFFVLSYFFFSDIANAKDEILRIVGSSTVFPYTQAVVEELSRKSSSSVIPVLESTGTGGGMKIFCEGGASVSGASRRIKDSERKHCNANGIDDFVEILIGYDGITVALSAESSGEWNLTKKDLYMALAALVPDRQTLIENNSEYWDDIRSDLPHRKIVMFGPPPTSGTRDSFVEMVMEEGCIKHSYFQEQKSKRDSESYKKLVKSTCHRMRKDGAFIEAGENDNLIVRRLLADPRALGIFGYAFLYENEDVLRAVAIEGVKPSFESIADSSYGISRPLFIYFREGHLRTVKSLSEFLEEYRSDRALGSDGYLSSRGLITKAEKNEFSDASVVEKRLTE